MHKKQRGTYFVSAKIKRIVLYIIDTLKRDFVDKLHYVNLNSKRAIKFINDTLWCSFIIMA